MPVLPLVGAIINATLRRSLSGNTSGGFATLMVLGSFVVSLLLFIGHDPATHPVTIEKIFDWINVGGMEIPFAFQMDALSLTMMLIVTGVGSLIHLYSVGYMHDDKRVATFLPC